MSRNAPEWYRRTRTVDSSKFSRMVTLMAVDTDYLKQITPLLKDLSPLESSAGFLTTVIRWILEYGEKYDRAPKDYLQKIFNREKDSIDPASVKLVEKFLLNINHQYVRGDFDEINVNYELDEAEAYIQERFIFDNQEKVHAAFAANRGQDAIRLKNDFTLPALDSEFADSDTIFAKEKTGLSDFMAERIAAPEMMMDPWLSDGSLNMLYAKRGTAKTWICLISALALTRKEHKSIEVGKWVASRPAGVLYLDGEMPKYYLQNRMGEILSNLKRLGLHEQNPDAPLDIISNSSIAENFRGSQMRLTESYWQDTIYNCVAKDDRYNLLILDNLASLTPGLDENKKEDWDPINQWILALRHLGVAVLFVHHAGKSGLQRGTSSREDALDNIIQLKKTKVKEIPSKIYNPEATYIDIIFDKARNSNPQLVNPFILEIVSTHRGRDIQWQTIERVKDDDDD